MAASSYPELQTLREAAERGELLLKRCSACGEKHYYPRPLCPFCFSDRTEWQTASGDGTVYSFSVMRRAAKPYVIAYVTLAEGPTMLTNLVDADPDKVRIGQKVKLAFRPLGDSGPQPVFAPA
jgi:uncharacterized protein